MPTKRAQQKVNIKTKTGKAPQAGPPKGGKAKAGSGKAKKAKAPSKVKTPARRQMILSRAGRGGSSKPALAPVAQGSVITTEGFRGQRYVMSGTSRLGTTGVEASEVGLGTVILNELIAPQRLPSERARALAKVFEHYVYRQARIQVQPMCPTTVRGGYIAVEIPDPTLQLAKGEELIDQLISMGAKISPFWEGVDINAIGAPTQEGYWTSNLQAVTENEPLLTDQSRFVMAVVADPAGADGNIPVVALIDWEVEFWGIIARPEGDTHQGDVEYEAPTNSVSSLIHATAGYVEPWAGDPLYVQWLKDLCKYDLKFYTDYVYELNPENVIPGAALQSGADAKWCWVSTGSPEILYVTNDLEVAMKNGNPDLGNGQWFNFTPSGKLTLTPVKNLFTASASMRDSGEVRGPPSDGASSGPVIRRAPEVHSKPRKAPASKYGDRSVTRGELSSLITELSTLSAKVYGTESPEPTAHRTNWKQVADRDLSRLQSDLTHWEGASSDRVWTAPNDYTLPVGNIVTVQ